MSKICEHCGGVLKDNAYFCIHCNALLEDKEQKPSRYTADSLSEKTSMPVRRKRKQEIKLNWKWIAVGAAAVVALFTAFIAVIALLITLFSGGPKSAVNNMEKVMNGKVNNLKKMAPQEYWDYQEKEENFDFEELKAYRKEAAEEYWNSESEYGKNAKTSIKIDEKTEVTEEKLDSIANALEGQYGIKAKKVKKAYILDTTVTLKGSEKSRSYETKLTAAKIGSKWYIIDYYEYGDEVYVTFTLHLK